MKIPQCLMILISPIVLLNTCAEPESKFALKVDFLLDSPVFKESYLSNIYHESDSLNYETKKYHPGDTIIRESRAKITETNYPDINHEEVYDYQAIDAYISNDTIHLILRETYGDLYIDIFNGKYSINEWNSGANIESNGKRKQPDNSLIHFKRSKLIFKTKSFNEGDRIYGFIYAETEEFYRAGEANINYYRGAFTTKILSKEEFYKYRIKRIFV